MAEQAVAREPAGLQAQSDLAEALLAKADLARGPVAEVDNTCALCGRTDQGVRRALEIRQSILAQNPTSPRAKRELAQAQTILGSILLDDVDPRALPWFDKALARGCRGRLHSRVCSPSLRF
jgi:hypothetical protein